MSLNGYGGLVGWVGVGGGDGGGVRGGSRCTVACFLLVFGRVL